MSALKNTSFYSIRANTRHFHDHSRFRQISVVLLLLVLTLNSTSAYAAVAQPMAKEGVEIKVHTTPDEASALVEIVRDGSTLSPIAETTSGGEKWFIVKTKSGNSGWIKAGDHAQTKQVHDYFRTLPKDDLTLAPASTTTQTAIKLSGENDTRVSILLRGARVYVVVTFNQRVSGYLLVDTGAYQTVISKRIASDLRLPAIERRVSSGVGGSIAHDVGLLDSIRVGTFVLRNFRVGILDHTSAPNDEGLLGFDFLGRFHTSIDPDKQEMILTPRKR